MKILAVLAFLAVAVSDGFSEYPYHVAFMDNGDFLCSGAFIAPKWILTVASCFAEYDRAKVEIIIGGQLDLDDENKIKKEEATMYGTFQRKKWDYQLSDKHDFVRFALIYIPESIKNKPLLVRVEDDHAVSGTVTDYKGKKLTVARVQINPAHTDKVEVGGVSECVAFKGAVLIDDNGVLVGIGEGCPPYGPGTFAAVASYKSWMNRVVASDGADGLPN